jgi:cytochrome P450
LKLSALSRALISDVRVLSRLRRYSLSEVVNAELAAVRLSRAAYDREKTEILKHIEERIYADSPHAGKFLAQLKAQWDVEVGMPPTLFIPLVEIGSGFFAASNIALATWVLDDPITFERASALNSFATVFTLQNVFTTSDRKLSDSLRQFFKRKTNGLSRHQLMTMIEIIQRRTDAMLSSIDPAKAIPFIPKVESMVLEAYAESFFEMETFPRSEECTTLIKNLWQLKSLRNNIPLVRFNPSVYVRMLWMRYRLFHIIADADSLLHQSGSAAAHEMANVYAEHGYAPGNLINALIPLYENISRAVVLALMELARAPSVQAQLRYEISKNTDCALGYCASTDTLLHRVWQETLRLWPPAPNQTRKTTAENNPFFPKGSRVVVVWSVFHRDPQVWGPDVDMFNPERWLSLTPGQQNNYRPFGSGPQRCVAMDYASIGGRAILKRIVESRLLQLPEASPPITTDRAYSRGPDPRLSLLRFAPLEQEEVSRVT